MSASNEKGCIKVIGVLAGIATIILAIITIIDRVKPPGPTSSLPLSSQSNGQPANTVNTEIHSLPTDTFLPPPTDTLIPTSISTEAPPPDTSPDIILDVGQSWRQGGLELAMIKSDWGQGWSDEGGGVYSFILTNLEPYDRSFRLSSENFSATDNFGNLVPMIPEQNVSIDEYCPSRTVQLLANQTIDLVSKLMCTQFMAFALTPRIDAGDISITEIIVSVSVSNISNAHWRIRIYH